MRPDHDDRSFDISGDYGRYGRTADAEGGKTQLSVYQQVVEHQVHQNRSYSRFHGNDRLTALTQGAGIDLDHGKGRKPDQHYAKVFFGVG